MTVVNTNAYMVSQFRQFDGWEYLKDDVILCKHAESEVNT